VQDRKLGVVVLPVVVPDDRPRRGIKSAAGVRKPSTTPRYDPLRAVETHTSPKVVLDMPVDGRSNNVPPPSIVGAIGRRTKSAERHIIRWRSTHPRLPRDVRERLAALLLADDDLAGGAQ